MADVPVIPIPTMTYPLSPRQSGFLVPTPGYDNRFGFHYQQGYYWAINPSQVSRSHRPIGRMRRF